MKALRSLFLFLGLLSVAACAAAPERPPALPASPVSPPPVVTAPAAAPQPDLPRAFTVHFDFDSAAIRASAMQILWEASQVATQLKPVAVRIHGYTDSAGNRAYNQALSERRAAAVAAQLVKLGVRVAVVAVKGQGIAAHAKGKGRDSRRVEVVFETASAALPSAPASASDTTLAAQSAAKAARTLAAFVPQPRPSVLKAPALKASLVPPAQRAPQAEPTVSLRHGEAVAHKTADPPSPAGEDFSRILE